MGKSSRWWDRAWYLTHGCFARSPECAHCWAASLAVMRAKNPNEKIAARHAGINTSFGGWNGQVNLDAEVLDLPSRINRPTVFTAWDDLFFGDKMDLDFARICNPAAGGVPDEFIIRALGTARAAASTFGHSFVILTKRPARMARVIGVNPSLGERIYLGTTVGCEATVSRLDDLMALAHNRLVVSAEPLLEPIDLGPYLRTGRIVAVMAGGETGPKARPAPVDGMMDLQRQCMDAGVPFFFKGWGKHPPSIDQEADALVRAGRRPNWDHEIPWLRGRWPR